MRHLSTFHFLCQQCVVNVVQLQKPFPTKYSISYLIHIKLTLWQSCHNWSLIKIYVHCSYFLVKIHYSQKTYTFWFVLLHSFTEVWPSRGSSPHVCRSRKYIPWCSFFIFFAFHTQFFFIIRSLKFSCWFVFRECWCRFCVNSIRA